MFETGCKLSTEELMTKLKFNGFKTQEELNGYVQAFDHFKATKWNQLKWTLVDGGHVLCVVCARLHVLRYILLYVCFV